MEAKMKRSFLLVFLSMLVFSCAVSAQETGRLEITLQRAANANTVAGPVSGAKVIVMHWTNPGLHPSIVQDRIATTDQTGMCSVELPPGIYDVFISANELAPRAYQISIKAGATASYAFKLAASPTQLRPIQ
jgi:hypothetical protein